MYYTFPWFNKYHQKYSSMDLDAASCSKCKCSLPSQHSALCEPTRVQLSSWAGRGLCWNQQDWLVQVDGILCLCLQDRMTKTTSTLCLQLLYAYSLQVANYSLFQNYKYFSALFSAPFLLPGWLNSWPIQKQGSKWTSLLLKFNLEALDDNLFILGSQKPLVPRYMLHAGSQCKDVEGRLALEQTKLPENWSYCPPVATSAHSPLFGCFTCTLPKRSTLATIFIMKVFSSSERPRTSIAS